MLDHGNSYIKPRQKYAIKSVKLTIKWFFWLKCLMMRLIAGDKKQNKIYEVIYQLFSKYVGKNDLIIILQPNSFFSKSRPESTKLRK